MPTDRDLLSSAYDAFNARDIAAALAVMHPDVDWPNGLEGGRIHGQWSVIDPHVEPRRFGTDESGRLVVDVHQVIRDRAGTVIADQMVQHVYVVHDGLIRRMDIRKS